MVSEELIGLNKLVDVTWRVENKKVAVDLQVRDQPSQVGVEPSTHHETFEMSQGVLEAMLEGLGRIRDQLAQV